jgi:PAS domain S-box-containing protein
MTAPDAPSFELQALLDAAADAVILINGRGRIEAFNPAAERLFGYVALEVLGENVNMLMTDSDRHQHDAYLERYQRTGVPHIIGIGREVVGRRKDGTVFSAALSVGRIANAEPPRYVGFLQDLTLRHQTLAAVVRERDRANGYLEAVQTILWLWSTNRHVSRSSTAKAARFLVAMRLRYWALTGSRPLFRQRRARPPARDSMGSSWRNRIDPIIRNTA